MSGYGKRLLVILSLWVGASFGPAFAESIQDAEDRFAEGEFSEAVDLAARMAEAASGKTSARAHALTARAALTIYGLEPFVDGAEDLLDRAEQSARAAIAADPEHMEGYLQLALALGYKGRRMGPIEAHMKGLAVEARMAIDKGLEITPNDPFALASIGAWHMEIVAGAGESLAQLLYGALLDDGMAAFERARMAAPNNPLFDVQYAASLLSVDPEAYRDEALKVLNEAQKKDPRTALERIYVNRAAALSAKLESGDASLIHDYLLCLQGVPEAEPVPHAVPDLTVMRP